MKYRIRRRDPMNWVIEAWIEDRPSKAKGDWTPHWGTAPLGHYPTLQSALKAYADKGLGDMLDGRSASQLSTDVDEIVERIQGQLTIGGDE